MAEQEQPHVNMRGYTAITVGGLPAGETPICIVWASTDGGLHIHIPEDIPVARVTDAMLDELLAAVRRAFEIQRQIARAAGN